MMFESLENRTFLSAAPAAVRPANLTGQNPAAASLTGLEAFRADPRFSGIDGTGVSVAVLDTGADLANPAFGPDNDRNGVADRIVYQYDFGDRDADASDPDGHGTHVASIIGSSDNRFLGVAPGVNLIILKVFTNGSGTAATSSVEDALRWCADNADRYNIAAVNLSMGWGSYADPVTREYSDELAALTARNVIPIAAAGNDYYVNNFMPAVAYPAADPNALAVGAVWSRDAGGPFVFTGGSQDYSTGPDRIASFSQRDPDQLDILAPGTLVTGAAPGGGLLTLSGTSQATAYISGLAVIARQLAQRDLGRTLNFAEFRGLLQSSGTTVFDGDDEDTNVQPTYASYKRADAMGLGEAIRGLRPQSAATPAKPYDFDGDGHADLLWRHTTWGANSIWFMNGAGVASQQYITPVGNQAWEIIGSGDFNRDGKADIAWFNTQNRLVSIWFMDGTTRLANPVVGQFTLPGFTAAAVGDMNNDGSPDILFRNPNWGDGRNFVWEMGGADGLAVNNGVYFTPVGNPAWRIVGTGDVDGDGKTDVVWHNTENRRNSVWLMDGYDRLANPLLPDSDPATDGTPVAVADIDGDNKADLILRNYTPGSPQAGFNSVWRLNGATRVDTRVVGVVSDRFWILAGHGDPNEDRDPLT